MIEYTEQQLRQLSNEQIKNHFLHIRSQLIMGYQAVDNKSLEIYFCYVTKELQNRDIK